MAARAPIIENPAAAAGPGGRKIAVAIAMPNTAPN